ncbi:MAG: DUF4406 domain-containing protein [Oscillospiraceae bacterium]
MNINKFNSEGYCDPTAFEALCNVEKAEKAYCPLVYVCSPYAGNIAVNTENARRYSRFAVEQNCIPLTPHLLYPVILNENNPAERELGLFFGIVLLCKCSEIWVFGDNISSGMSAEIDKAKRKNIPVRYFNDACEEVKTNA